MFLSPRHASEYIIFYLKRSRLKFDLGSRSRGHPDRSCCTSSYASRREKQKETNLTSVSFFNPKLLKKTGHSLKWPLRDLGDLYRGLESKLSYGLSIKVQNNMNQADLNIFEVHMKILNFLPLAYNGRVTKLT